jgi:ABC-type Fe3+/spermidine/putrescine transport system ATPase subunit
VRLRARGFELEARDQGGYRVGEQVLVGVRPERLLLEAEAPAGKGVPGVLDDEIYLGDRTDWRVRLGEEVLTVAEAAASARPRARGDAVSVVIPPEAVLRLEERPS